MIPRAHVTHWRQQAPWPADAQVEQDLVLTRALVELFSDDDIAKTLAFRGGTALHKLFLDRPARYSEDIDLVQRVAGAIGPILDCVRARLDPWLGDASSGRSKSGAALIYRFETTSLPVQRMRLKVEINTREHFAVLGEHDRALSLDSPWFAGAAKIPTFRFEELLGTKLRALYQRKKGRDLFDLWLALSTHDLDDTQIVHCFERYVEHDDRAISRAAFEANFAEKLGDATFLGDIAPLIAEPDSYDVGVAARMVSDRLISKLPKSPRHSRRANT